jgi:hypothetical protein
MGHCFRSSLLCFDHPIRRIVFIAILIGLFALSGCASHSSRTYVRNGKVYGRVEGAFRHRWWNYYERALSFMEGEFYQEALSDLEHAMKQRFADKRMARTYGMHFVDYFPHRERGLIHYLMSNYEDAKKELELSMTQQPSAKAQFYLDKIRKILMEREKPVISFPSLLVDLPSDEIWTKDAPFIISGTVSDKQYVSKIMLSDRHVFLEGAQQQVDFKETFKLDQGKHVIPIYAENLLGGNVSRELIIHVDRLGPLITLEPDSFGAGGPSSIRGFLYDDSGEISLSVNGVKFPVPKGEDVPFTVPISKGIKHVILLAKDKLGNETKADVDIKNMTALRGNPLIAALDDGTIMSDSRTFRLAVSFFRKDSRKPSVKLGGWTDEQTVFLEKVYLEGEVRDENDIIDLTVNDTPILRRKGRIIFFNHLVDLQEGENLIKIEAKDKAGNLTKKEISIIRQIPKIFQLDSRFSITLLPFESKGLLTGLSDMYENLFLVKLMDQNRFRIIERQKLDAVLQEQKLSRTKLIDRNTALELGRLVAAQAILVGNFIETRIGIEIVARLIDNETSEILAVEDVYDEFKDRASLLALAEGLAIKFHREFPLLDGMIVRKEGKIFYTDLGKGKVRPQRRVIIFREGEPILHPETGKMLGCDTEVIGYARVTQVMNEMSKATLLKGLKTEDIILKDKVMTE